MVLKYCLLLSLFFLERGRSLLIFLCTARHMLVSSGKVWGSFCLQEPCPEHWINFWDCLGCNPLVHARHGQRSQDVPSQVSLLLFHFLLACLRKWFQYLNWKAVFYDRLQRTLTYRTLSNTVRVSQNHWEGCSGAPCAVVRYFQSTEFAGMARSVHCGPS